MLASFFFLLLFLFVFLLFFCCCFLLYIVWIEIRCYRIGMNSLEFELNFFSYFPCERALKHFFLFLDSWLICS